MPGSYDRFLLANEYEEDTGHGFVLELPARSVHSICGTELTYQDVFKWSELSAPELLATIKSLRGSMEAVIKESTIDTILVIDEGSKGKRLPIDPSDVTCLLNQMNLTPDLTEEHRKFIPEEYEANYRARQTIERWRRVKQTKEEARIKRAELSGSRRDKAFMAVGRRDGFSCSNGCGETKKLHLDHIVPLILGGTNDLDNLQILCQRCDLTKGAKPPEEA